MGLKGPSYTGLLRRQSELDDVSDVAKMGRQPIGSFWCVHVCFPSGLVSMNRSQSGRKSFPFCVCQWCYWSVTDLVRIPPPPKHWSPPALNIVGPLDPGFVQTCSTWTWLYKPLSSDMFPVEPRLSGSGRSAFVWNAFFLLCYVYSASLRPGSMIDTSILGKRRLKSVYFLNTLFIVNATPPWCKPFSRCQKKTCSLLSKYVRQ